MGKINAEKWINKMEEGVVQLNMVSDQVNFGSMLSYFREYNNKLIEPDEEIKEAVYQYPLENEKEIRELIDGLKRNRTCFMTAERLEKLLFGEEKEK